jgi:hypothetical protein
MQNEVERKKRKKTSLFPQNYFAVFQIVHNFAAS